MNGMVAAASMAVAVVAAARSLWSPCGLSMLTSITPFAERARGHRYSASAVWFVVGAVIGGAGLGMFAAIGAVIVALLDPPGPVLLVLAAVAALLGVAADLRIGGFHLPRHPRQVDETWLLRYRRWAYAIGFGAQIGSGFATYVMTSAVYLTVVLAVLTGSPELAFLVGVTFGLTRGMAVLANCRATSADRLRSLLARIESLSGASEVAAVGIQFAAAVALVGAAWGTLVPALAAVAGWLSLVIVMVGRTVRARGVLISVWAASPLMPGLGSKRHTEISGSR